MARAGETADRGVMTTNGQPVMGTTIFDGDQAIKGYALNKMCMSFDDAARRAEFARTRTRTARGTVSAPPSARRSGTGTCSS